MWCVLILILLLGAFFIVVFRQTDGDLIEELYEKGYINERGEIIKCLNCDSENLRETKWGIECTDCGEIFEFDEEI